MGMENDEVRLVRVAGLVPGQRREALNKIGGREGLLIIA